MKNKNFPNFIFLNRRSSDLVLLYMQIVIIMSLNKFPSFNFPAWHHSGNFGKINTLGKFVLVQYFGATEDL